MMGTRSSTNGLVLGAPPRVELLPREVRQRERAHGLRRLSLQLAVVVLILVGGAFAFAFYGSVGANAELATAQRTTVSLQGGSKNFSELTAAAKLIADGKEARAMGASTEILWNSVVGPIRSALPTGVVLDTLTMAGHAPGAADLTPDGPLGNPRQATIAMTLFSPTFLDAPAVARKLVDVPGFADASLGSVTAVEGGYMANITLNINEKAFSGRFSKDAVK
jgi:hypothetical protein